MKARKFIVALMIVMMSMPVFAQTWTAPNLSGYLTGSTPENTEEFFLYHVGQAKFLTPGTTWGTHTALTSDINEALMYWITNTSQNSILLLSSRGATFVANDGGDCYVDYNNQSGYPHRWTISSNGTTCRIYASSANNAAMAWGFSTSCCLGWNPNNIDRTNTGASLGTNYGVFLLDPSSVSGSQVDWKFLTKTNYDKYNAKYNLYNLLLDAKSRGISTTSASRVYNNSSSTTDQLNAAAEQLASLIAADKFSGASPSSPIDATELVTNPDFNSNANGWTVNMPGAQNKGYQTASYSNGGTSIYRFVEAWIPSGNYLGAGSILQTIYNMPEGKYVLEADVIATDQSGKYDPVTGVYLVGESELDYATEVATQSGAPQHFTLSLLAQGTSLTFGLRTMEDATANWIAFDNVKLTYYGKIERETTGVSITPTSLDIFVGEKQKITANVATNDEMFNRVTWQSSNEDVATVDKYGNVTGVHSGSATISATAEGTTYTASIPVTVSVNRPTSLSINEVQSANVDQYLDHSYNYGGWIEIYNNGARDIPLAGLYISDGINEYQLTADNGNVPGYGFQVLYFDHNAKDGNFGKDAVQQIPFKLNVEGGTISLLDGDKNELTSLTYPMAVPRCSYARTTDNGAGWGTTGNPTPGESNNSSTFATERMPAPTVSVDGGVFEEGEEFDIFVDIPEGATLAYTFDGSTPSLTNGYLTTSGAFYVSSTSICRFRLFKDGYLPSAVVTRSYIFKNHDYYLPVISLVTAPGNLYDDTYGVYTKGTNGIPGNGQSSACNWNMDWERPVNLEYMVPETNTEGDVSFISVLNQETDFEISGGWTRAYGAGWTDGKYWPMKGSFRLKTDKRYEFVNELDYPVFPNKPYNKYKCWQVRNGGNDTSARIIDPALQQIVLTSGINIDCQDYQPAHVFFNGEYLGMLNIRESNNKHFGYSNFGIDTDDMDQFDLSNALYNQKAGDSEAWLELLSRAATLADVQTEEAYERVKELLDVDEYANYMALECFIGSNDWVTNVNNVKGYRSRSNDGRFRFVFFDADAAFGSTSMLSSLLYNNYGANVDDLFRYMMNYGPFANQFIDAMSIINGCVMVPERADKIVQSMYNNINPALGFEGLGSSTWVADRIRDYHNGSVMFNMASTMNVWSSYGTISSNVEGARILLNGQELPTGKFDGILYGRDYKDLKLTAKAPAGYTFKGWYLPNMSTVSYEYNIFDYESEGWQYYDQGSMDAYSWKAVDFDAIANGWKNAQAPFGYANAGKYMQTASNTILDYGTNASQKRLTYYFRKMFYLDEEPGSSDQESFRLEYKVDDGFVFYANGNYVDGHRMDESGAYYDFPTGDNNYVGDTPETGSIIIPNSYLHKGWNVIAAEVHNNKRGSSDLFWDAALFHIYNEEDVFAADETLDLNQQNLSTFTLTARFAPIADEKARWEAGATPIRINEVSASNDIYINEYNKKEDWVELYNTTDEDIDLQGMFLSDNSRKPQKWEITGENMASTIIPAHGTRIIWCDQLSPMDELHAPFRLDNADGATVSIQAQDGSWADRLQYFAQDRWQTYGRYPDGCNHEGILTIPTIDKSNRYSFYDFNVASSTEWETEDMAITLELADGWNWVSHNLNEDVHSSRFTAYAQSIRGQKNELFKDDVFGWTGRLSTIDMAAGYKLQMGRSTEVTLRGLPYDVDVPVSLSAGWNWLGFPLLNATTLESALANYQPTEGDQIVGIDAFATYENGSWGGSLTSLQPGQAYLLRSGRAQELRWNALTRCGAQHRRYAASMRTDRAPWEMNIHAYPDVMTLTATLNASDIDLTGGYHIGAFVDGECRGVAHMEDDLIYMNIHGEGIENVEFRLLDAEGNAYKATERVRLQSQGSVGSRRAPFVLNFNSNGVEDVITDIASLAVRPVSTQYYSLSGQRLSAPVGVCIQKVRMTDGSVVVKKINANSLR